MSTKRFRHMGLALVATVTASCELAGSPSGDPPADVTTRTSGLTAQQRLTACAQDPRVVTGLVTPRSRRRRHLLPETFNGNGRTCGTCHPAQNNSRSTRVRRHAAAPRSAVRLRAGPGDWRPRDRLAARRGGILENVDGFEDPTHKFVIRGVPHTLSLATSIAADPGRPQHHTPPVDSAPAGAATARQRSLRNFLRPPSSQHYPKTLRGGRASTSASPLPRSCSCRAVPARARAPERAGFQPGQHVRRPGAGGQAGVPRSARAAAASRATPTAARTSRNRPEPQLRHRHAPRPEQAVHGSVLRRRLPVRRRLRRQGARGPERRDPGLRAAQHAEEGFGNNTFNTPPVIESADTLPGIPHQRLRAVSGPADIENVVTF